MSTCPTIVNIHKVKGVRPHFTLYAGRHVQYTEFIEDSKWHNPFHPQEFGDYTLPMFKTYMMCLLAGAPVTAKLDDPNHFEIVRAITRARNKWASWDLAELTSQAIGCWCHPGPCHVNVLIELWKEKFDKPAHKIGQLSAEAWERAARPLSMVNIECPTCSGIMFTGYKQEPGEYPSFTCKACKATLWLEPGFEDLGMKPGPGTAYSMTLKARSEK